MASSHGYSENPAESPLNAFAFWLILMPYLL
jgi:hypothetical protein